MSKESKHRKLSAEYICNEFYKNLNTCDIKIKTHVPMKCRNLPASLFIEPQKPHLISPHSQPLHTVNSTEYHNRAKSMPIDLHVQYMGDIYNPATLHYDRSQELPYASLREEDIYTLPDWPLLRDRDEYYYPSQQDLTIPDFVTPYSLQKDTCVDSMGDEGLFDMQDEYSVHSGAKYSGLTRPWQTDDDSGDMTDFLQNV